MRNKLAWLPLFPLSVILFYLIIVFLGSVGIIPNQLELLSSIASLYERFGLIGLAIITFIEGLAYIGHQFPGMTIILVSMALGSTNLISMVSVVLVISLALMVSSMINYLGGRYFSKRNPNRVKREEVGKTIFVAALHPAFLSLYFFNSGLEKKNFRQVFLVPLLVFPYGLVVIYILRVFSGFFINTLFSSEWFFLGIFIIWFFVELIERNMSFIKNKINFKRRS